MGFAQDARPQQMVGDAATTLGLQVEMAVDINPALLSTYKHLWGPDHARQGDLCSVRTLRELQGKQAAFICL
eukprot:4281954-Prorocentrum_lima.AAC.1